MTEISELKDLTPAQDGSWYTIPGAGGNLEEWVTGYEEALKEAGIGTPVAWYRTTGKMVNQFAKPTQSFRKFPGKTTFLLFPLNGLDIGRLAIFKLEWRDSWFNDVVESCKTPREEEEEW